MAIKKQRKIFADIFKHAITIWILCLSLLYFLFIRRQFSEIFFESQFLHVDFLGELIRGDVSFKSFFTVFAEHLFPGYNLILAMNYYAFDVWGGFDPAVYGISLALCCIAVVFSTKHSELGNANVGRAFLVVATLLLFSTTNNPQWGMALAAAVGVPLFLFAIYFLSRSFDENENVSIYFYLLMPLTIVFFLGGYAVGVAGAVGLMCMTQALKTRSIDKKIIVAFAVLVLCIILYVIILTQYGVLLKNKPTGKTFDLFAILKFALAMAGASVLGKAVFEAMPQFWPYYLCGSILFFWTVFLYKDFIQNPKKGRLFFLAISAYSVSNILLIALFRFSNGIEGALGQWYNVHTKLMAVAVCFYLFSTIRWKQIGFLDVCKIVSLVVIVVFAVFGYCRDWTKSKYISNWKQQFVAQAPLLLAFPDALKDKTNLMNTMLWNYDDARKGVGILYDNNLSMFHFKNKDPVIAGQTSDGWLIADQPITILCPIGTKAIDFKIWRPENSLPSTMVVRSENNKKIVGNGQVHFNLNNERPILLLDASNEAESQPIISGGDIRKLVAIVGNVHCSTNS